MISITYQQLDKENLPNHQIIALYQSVGWSNYTKDSTSLISGIQNSLSIFAAFIEERLIALIRSNRR